MNNKQKLKFIEEDIIVNALCNDAFVKSAQDTSSLVSAISSYVKTHINEDDKAGSIIDFLAPGAVYSALSALGLRLGRNTSWHSYASFSCRCKLYIKNNI